MDPVESQTSENQDVQNTKTRSPWIAGVLAFLSLGLGHVYVGRSLLGITFAVGGFLFYDLFMLVLVLTDSLGVMHLTIFMVLAILFVLGQLISAVVLALRNRGTYTLKKYNKIWVYAAYTLCFILVSQINHVGMASHVIEYFSLPSESMKPTMVPGDRFQVVKLGSRNRNPKRGDLIIFKEPTSGEIYAKRAIALSNDKFEMILDPTLFPRVMPLY